ncbi:unnamed protein product [Owenia fusiformis]|uniref:Uncharacterized protein n=1 Tax=Owenia fusiformis TaxID=6347 RepID=A0A8J1XLV0_OWEFU|nr:unnamed protein product [Owenia fusiformis]
MAKCPKIWLLNGFVYILMILDVLANLYDVLTLDPSSTVTDLTSRKISSCGGIDFKAWMIFPIIYRMFIVLVLNCAFHWICSSFEFWVIGWFMFPYFLSIGTIHYFIMICHEVIYKVNSLLYIQLFIALFTSTFKVLILGYILYQIRRRYYVNKKLYEKLIKRYKVTYAMYIVAYIWLITVTGLSLLTIDYPKAVMEHLDKFELYFVKKGAINNGNKMSNNVSMAEDWTNGAYIIPRKDILHISGLEVVKSEDNFIDVTITCHNVTIYDIPKEFNKLCDDCNDEINIHYQLIVADTKAFYKKPVIHYYITIRSLNGPNLQWRYLDMLDTYYDIYVLLQNKDPALDIHTKQDAVFYRPPSDQIKLIESYATCTRKFFGWLNSVEESDTQ